MKLHISNIPAESGMQINASSSKDEWLKKVFIEVFGPDKFKKEDGGRLDLQIFRSDRNLTLIGGIILKFHPSCDRCLTSFAKQEQVPIHQIMAPAHTKGKKKVEMDVEDEDFGYYKNDEIDLSDVAKEYILLAQQMVNLCNEECKGLCQKCRKNLNNGPCKCKVKKEKDSPFAVLKKLH
ncbi:MAG: hypothetical protein COV46_00755 [Deltaproteobacteria bacterium CG11_big_fil_rev_8_21_14_0_20_49_13]|nr:MAG: hypothetical protein COV46_00755 [Deltaproteobacteria bacterium CG11_big_fil_rev_8_21_14_0_20_49_13]